MPQHIGDAVTGEAEKEDNKPLGMVGPGKGVGLVNVGDGFVLKWWPVGGFAEGGEIRKIGLREKGKG